MDNHQQKENLAWNKTKTKTSFCNELILHWIVFSWDHSCGNSGGGGKTWRNRMNRKTGKRTLQQQQQEDREKKKWWALLPSSSSSNQSNKLSLSVFVYDEQEIHSQSVSPWLWIVSFITNIHYTKIYEKKSI